MTESGFELLTFGVSACSLKQLSNLAPLNLVREIRQAARSSLPGAEADARTRVTSLKSLGESEMSWGLWEEEEGTLTCRDVNLSC